MRRKLKKLLDNTPKSVYNIFCKDGESFDLSSISDSVLGKTLYYYYDKVKTTYDQDRSLFVSPPIFAGGFFRDILWDYSYPDDLDVFVNSHGLTIEEAEDNLCLFLHRMGIHYEELYGPSYAGLGEEGTFRVFNVFDGENFGIRAHPQFILKDLGPPEDDPLYVTKDFNYNHAKAALSVEGEPAIHYHGHAVAGKAHRIHVQYGPKGFAKCNEKLGLSGFERIDLSPPLPAKPKSDIKMPSGNPCAEIILPTNTYLEELHDFVREQENDGVIRPIGIGLVAALQERQQQRNQFVQQFVPNNRRPLP